MSKLDHRKLNAVLDKIGLGNLTAELEPVTGGLIHKMWRATTAEGEFAVKQLNPTIMARPRARGDILGGEDIARRFAKNGISVSAALSFEGETVLKVGEAEIMLFEWVDGITLEENDVTTQHCRQIGALFGQMHKCKLTVENMPLPASRAFDEAHWDDIIDRARLVKCQWVGEVSMALRDLVRFSAAYADALPSLQANMVACHRDLDIKNVMWDSNDNPVIIDWEAAGPVNPMWELLDAALNWCGQTSGQPDKDRFQSLIAGYRSVLSLDEDSGFEDGPTLLSTAFAGCLGARMEWLEFNMQRSINPDTPPDERMLGAKQVTCTLADILSLARRESEFMGWLQPSEQSR